MRAKEFIIESGAGLQAANLANPNNVGRFTNLINNIKTGKPLYLFDGTPVVIDKDEAERLQSLYNEKMFKGSIGLLGADNKQYSLSSFLKTVDYGGQAIPPGLEKETGPTKEGLKLKPSQIGIVDKHIPAGQLGQLIASNPILQSSQAGQLVIELTTAVSNHQTPVLPKVDSAVKASINDYASEYIGVWALITGQTNFPNRNKFLAWLQSPIENLTLYFPSKANTSIADSYALVDPASGHQINISSKGKGGGAPPAISGLKVPDHIRQKQQYATAVAFIDIVQDKTLPKPTTVAQPFVVMNMLAESVPNAIPQQFRKFLPWNVTEITAQVNDSLKNNTLMPKHAALLQGIDWQKESTDGGKLTHVVKVAVMEMVNGGAIPEFEAAVLEILDYNFIQQYTTIGRNGILQFTTQWPAKVDGKVTVETKSGATDPTKGSFSFKLHF